MADGATGNRWASRMGRAALWLGLAAVVAALLAAVGSGAGWWPFRTGFTVLTAAFGAAILAVVLALVALLLGLRTKGGKRAPIIALLVAGLFVAYLGNQIMQGRSVPAIHDATTDLADPPAFTTLKLRPDNLANVPDNDRPELAAMSPEGRWKVLHGEAYGDLRSVRLPLSVPEATDRAAALAKARGWDVAAADPQGGRVEATATTRFFRFKDDVVVRVRPDPEGGGSIVDMRSVSRVGVSDVGVNAQRIRDFLADLQRQG